MLGPFEVLILFVVTLGPLKIIGPFAARTQGLTDQRLHQLAFRAFIIATGGAVIGVLLGQFLAARWHISLPAMTMTSGIILFLVALNQLMQQYKPADIPAAKPLPAAPTAAAAELVFPIVLTPYGIAAAITLLISGHDMAGTLTILALLILVMCLDLAAMWYVRRILAGPMALALQILGSVLAVLQVGLAIQLLLVGLRTAHIISA